MSKPDAFEVFMSREANSKKSKSAQNKSAEINTNKQKIKFQPGEPPRRGSRAFPPGQRIGYLEVLNRDEREGAYGNLMVGDYLCQCHAPAKEGGECGRIIPVSYRRLYYSRPTSCGCVPKKKHPTVNYENLRMERIEVLRWDYDEELWECLCHECGALCYRKNIKEIRALAGTCEGHEIARFKAPLRKARAASATR